MVLNTLFKRTLMRDSTKPNRRGALRWIGSGILGTFAGCSAISSDGNQSTATDTTEQVTIASELGAEPEPTAVRIVASEFRTVRTSVSTDNLMWGILKNTGQRHVAHLEAKATFRNETGTILDTTTASIDGFEPGGVWEAYIQSFDNPNVVAKGELSVTKIIFGPPPNKPDTVAISEESLRPAHAFKIPTAAGEVENTGEKTIDRLEVHAKFYAGNDNLLDTGSTNIISLSPDETRKFEIEFSGYEERAAPRVSSYDVSLAE